MFDDITAREMREDAANPKIRKDFKDAEQKYLDWLKQHPGSRSIDSYFLFINSLQEVFGPFAISREILAPPYDFRL